MQKNNLNLEAINKLFAVEGLAGGQTAGKSSARASLFATLTPTEEESINTIIDNNCRVGHIPTDHFSKEQIEKATLTEQDKMFHKVSDKILSPQGSALRAKLPKATRKVIDALSVQRQSIMNRLSGAQNDADKHGAAFEMEQIDNVMHNVVFGTLTSAYETKVRNKNTVGYFGMENVQSYNTAIFYPVFENSIVWLNVAGTVYPKLIPIKQIMNDITQIVIHTKRMMLICRDAENNIIETLDRAELYNTFDNPKLDKYRQYMTKDVIIRKEDFNKEIMLRTTPLAGMGNKAALGSQETIKSDFFIRAHKVGEALEGATVKGKIMSTSEHTYNAEGPTISEVDYRGATVRHTPDKKKPNEFYIIAIQFDGKKHSMILTVSKSADGATLPDIQELTFEVKIHDINFVTSNNATFEEWTHPYFLATPPMSRREIPQNVNEYQYIDSRNEGDTFNTLIGLNNEFISNQKEKVFYNGILDMEDTLKIDKEAEKGSDLEGTTLYMEEVLDLNAHQEYRRVESIGLRLSNTLTSIKTNYEYMAKTTQECSISMLGHTTSLNVLNPNLRVVTGEVSNSSNGQFLGVEQKARTYVVTLGDSLQAPISVIVVG
ncbi:MAG: hypothetical protein ACRC92_14800, partial [Peptostreptococcaceae bacterium]